MGKHLDNFARCMKNFYFKLKLGWRQISWEIRTIDWWQGCKIALGIIFSVALAAFIIAGFIGVWIEDGFFTAIGAFLVFVVAVVVYSLINKNFF